MTLKTKLIKRLIAGLYVPEKKEIAKFIADGLVSEHRIDLVKRLIPEGQHLHSNPKRGAA